MGVYMVFRVQGSGGLHDYTHSDLNVPYTAIF